MMKDAVTILGGEQQCSLGAHPERLSHLHEGTTRISSQSLIVNGETLCYPYYLIAGNKRPTEIEELTQALHQVILPLLEKNGMDAARLARCGLFLGSSTNDLSLAIPLGKNSFNEIEAGMARRRVGNGYCAEVLRGSLGLRGLEWTYNTACTSSANALMDAASMLQSGLIDYALVVGIEVVTPGILDGFISLQLLSSTEFRPFDRERNGFVLGETVNALLLSRESVAPSGWHYLGGMSNCETFSITSGNPDGEQFASVMRAALRDAGLRPEQIDVVKAHGTASPLSDLTEIKAMRQVFTALPPFLSLKPFIGHTLGGCATAELLLFMECVDAGFVPRSIQFATMDEELGEAPLQQRMALENGAFMMNFFGFGGNNTSFIVRKGNG